MRRKMVVRLFKEVVILGEKRNFSDIGLNDQEF